jgi:NTP pyrophosphatase (non-canonical NTP hydrolase)
MSWEYAHYETAWAVHLHAGDDELPTPAAVFRRKEDAEEYIGRERQKALLDDYDGDAAAAKARGAKAADYLHDAGVFEVRNCYVPWWNSMGDVDHDPGPLPDYELAELVRLNAPEAGEDTLAAVERRLAEWHLRKYGPAPVDLARTVAKLGEEFGELCRAFLRGGKAIGREAADMVFVLFHLVRGCGYSLTAAVNEKIDSFAGGGGASTGIEAGVAADSAGRSDVAINHDAAAIAMHTTVSANHPRHGRHFTEDVFKASTRGR